MDDLLRELDALLTRYGATLSYTTDDDGIHVTTAEAEVVIPHGASPMGAVPPLD